MRVIACVIFSLTLILAGCLIMGCSSLPFPQGQQQETPATLTGFSSGNISYETATYNNFDDAIADLTGPVLSGSGNSSRTEIRYILGTDVDSTGDAERWVFAVDNANTTYLVTYDNNGRSIVAWPAGFSGYDISTDQIITPGNSLIITGP